MATSKTVKVALLVPRAAVIDGRAVAQDKGQVIEVPPDEAERMVEAGQCELVKRGAANKETTGS